MTEQRHCKLTTCGKLFSVDHSSRRLFCDDVCRKRLNDYRARHRATNKLCERHGCDTTLLKEQKRFCSSACRNKAQNRAVSPATQRANRVALANRFGLGTPSEAILESSIGEWTSWLRAERARLNGARCCSHCGLRKEALSGVDAVVCLMRDCPQRSREVSEEELRRADYKLAQLAVNRLAPIASGDLGNNSRWAERR